MISLLLNELQQRTLFLQKLLIRTRKSMLHAPEGRLRYSFPKNRKTVQYYHRTSSSGCSGTYIPVGRKDLAAALAQKEYDGQLLLLAAEEQALLEKLIKFYSEGAIEEIYQKLPVPFQVLVQPFEPPKDQYIQDWLAVSYKRKPFSSDYPEYYSASGIRVRSKSELLIAVTLLRMNIPFRYEYPVRFKKSGVIHPDFTVLNVHTRKTLYWEHFGMMDDNEYAENAIDRLSLYCQNGYFPGDSLILSFETKNNPLCTKQVELLAAHYLL